MISQKVEFNVHFIGIGGVSMRGLAEYFKSVGFSVSGSDREFSLALEKLAQKGIKTYVGHSENNLKNAHVVVYSDAIDDSNVELKKARELGLYVLSRGEALRSVVENFSDVVGVAGCHGKTTTTCMLAHIFKCAKLEFTAHIGGEDLSLGNCVIDGSKVFLSEVCEFKKNINKFNADYAVCLNVGKDHMDCYDSEEELKLAYLNFAKRAYKSIINQKDEYLASQKPANSIGFSVEGSSDVFAKDVKSIGGKYCFSLYRGDEFKCKIELSVYGRHNVENALAAATCALALGIDVKHIKKGLKNFKGVVRRFEEIGEINEGGVVADYAHHPDEILACIKTAKEVCKGKLFVVFQPHTYSRTIYLKEEFIRTLSQIENLSLFKTFSARENYKKGGSAYDLHRQIDNSCYFEDVNSMIACYKNSMSKNDMLLILGAGDLYYKVKEKIN